MKEAVIGLIVSLFFVTSVYAFPNIDSIFGFR